MEVIHKVIYLPIFWNAIWILPAKSSVFSGCTTIRNETTEISANVGQLLTLECKKAISGDDCKEGLIKDASAINCIIRDVQKDTNLLNITQNASKLCDLRNDEEISKSRINVTETATEYQIVIDRKGSCKALNIKLLLMDNESCEVNMDKAYVLTLPLLEGQNFRFGCEVPEESPTILDDFLEQNKLNISSIEFRWLFGCTNKLPNNSAIPKGNSLSLMKIRYSDNPGEYSCMARYHGKTIYWTHYKVCISPKSSRILSAKCTSQVAKIGGNVSVECNIDAGVGTIGRIGFKGYFKKVNGKLYDGHFCHDKYRAKTTYDRISCKSTRNVVRGKKCFDRTPTDEELERQKTKFTFVYSITNLNTSDFGEYEMTYFRLEGDTKVNFTINLDPEEDSLSARRVLTVIFAVFAVMIALVLILMVFCRLEIHWILHKAFTTRETGSKKYAAYLAYHYSKDMKETTPSLLQEFISSLDSHLQKSGARTFDSSKDSFGDECKVSSVSENLGDCHRVIIILTPEYIRDEWGVYEAYEAWKTTIENKGVKIIFLVFPTTLRAINDLRGDLKTSLYHALKRHKVIHWNGKLPITRKLWMQLDIQMPNLSSNDFEKIDSYDNPRIPLKV